MAKNSRINSNSTSIKKLKRYAIGDAKEARALYDLYQGALPLVQSRAHTMDNIELATFIRSRVVYMQNSKFTVLQDSYNLGNELRYTYKNIQDESSMFDNAPRSPVLENIVRQIMNEDATTDHEVVVVGANKSSKAAADVNTHLIQSIDKETDAEIERYKANEDALYFGFGVYKEGYLQKFNGNRLVYDNLYSEHVPVEDFFIDNLAIQFYDPIGMKGARDCARLHKYPVSEFLDIFGSDPKYDISGVKAGRYGINNYRYQQNYQQLSDRENITSFSVELVEYYNHEINMYAIAANNYVIYRCELTDEYKHGRLPFVVITPYPNPNHPYGDSLSIKLWNSILKHDWAEQIVLQNAQLSAYPMVVSATSSGLMPGFTVAPGANITVDITDGQNVKDVLNFDRAPDVSQTVMSLKNDMRDQISLTAGISENQLYTDPNQLATEIKQKQQSFVKNVAANFQRQIWTSIKYRVEMQLSSIRQFLTQPIKYPDGTERKRSFIAENAVVFQPQFGSNRMPKFIKQEGKQAYFEISDGMLEGDFHVYIESAVQKQGIDEVKQKNWVDQTRVLLEFAQSSPELMQNLNLQGMQEYTAELFGVEKSVLLKNAVPDGDKLRKMIDNVVAGRMEQAMGEVDVADLEVLTTTIQGFMAYTQSYEYNQLSTKSKRKIDDFTVMMIDKITEEKVSNTNPLQQQAAMPQQQPPSTPVSAAPVPTQQPLATNAI